MENVINNLLYAAPVLAVLALVFAFVKASSVSKQDAGTDRMKEIASVKVPELSSLQSIRFWLFSWLFSL